jgi:hypothetical protein
MLQLLLRREEGLLWLLLLLLLHGRRHIDGSGHGTIAQDVDAVEHILDVGGTKKKQNKNKKKGGRETKEKDTGEDHEIQFEF